MSDAITVASVNMSDEKGTKKTSVERIEIRPAHGVVGDAHAGPSHRQVSLLSTDSIGRFVAETGAECGPGDFAENLTLEGADLRSVAVFDLFRVGEVELEVTQIGKSCHGDNCAIFRQVGQCVMPTEGLFCRALSGGSVAPGDAVTFVPRPLAVEVITLSDRGFRGEYEDRSGPAIVEILEDFETKSRWQPRITTRLLPDDADRLRRALRSALDAGSDVIITNGGTGVGPRDVTPEVATEFCDRLIPGVMEMVRVKYGGQKPNALLSRGIAGTAGGALVYTLPGSPRAVKEYMAEILLTLEHALLTLRGIDPHG